MKNTRFIRLLIVWLVVIGFTSCEKQTLPQGCYRAIIVAESCGYVAQIQGVAVGETWQGMKNCANLSSLRSDDMKVGEIIYFDSYKIYQGPKYCTWEKTYPLGFPSTTVVLTNYSLTSCAEL